MDRQFGEVEEEPERVAIKPKGVNYTQNDLTGLCVEHSQEHFKEGQSVVLTLKDKYVLDEEDDDTLINVNFADEEKAAKNLENKKKKPAYKPYDEFDESGNVNIETFCFFV
jgi:U4/U6.U5 tri-snRNP-associated protein 1